MLPRSPYTQRDERKSVRALSDAREAAMVSTLVTSNADAIARLAPRTPALFCDADDDGT